MWRRRVISTKKRNINLDMIRVIAVFSVLSVHFFLHNGFYEEIVVGKRLFFMGTMRNFFNDLCSFIFNFDGFFDE